jgi:hypothetical protein
MPSVGQEVLSTPGIDRMTPAQIRATEQNIVARREREARYDGRIAALESRVSALEGHSDKQRRGGHGGARPGAGRPEGSVDK